MTIQPDDFIKFCENGDLNSVDKLLIKHREYIDDNMTIYCKNKSIHKHCDILLRIIHEFKYDSFIIYKMFLQIFKYSNINTLKILYDAYPELNIWNSPCNYEIVKCLVKKMKFDVLDFLGEINPNYDKSSVANLASKILMGQKNYETIKYFLDDCDISLIYHYCFHHGDYNYMKFLFDYYGNFDIQYQKYKWYCPNNIELFKLFLDMYPDFIYKINILNFLKLCFCDKSICIYIIENYDFDIYGRNNYIFRKMFNYDVEIVKYLMDNYDNIDYSNLVYDITCVRPNTIIYILELYPKISSQINMVWLLEFGNLTLEEFININRFIQFNELKKLFEIFIHNINYHTHLEYLLDSHEIVKFNEPLEVSKLLYYNEFDIIKRLIEKSCDVYVSKINIHRFRNLDFDEFCEIITFIKNYFPDAKDNFIYELWYYDDCIKMFNFLIVNNYYDTIDEDKLLKNICLITNIDTMKLIMDNYSYLFQDLSQDDIFINVLISNNFDIVMYYLKNYFDDIIVNAIDKMSFGFNSYNLRKILKFFDNNNYLWKNYNVLFDYGDGCYLKIWFDYFDKHGVEYDLSKIFNYYCTINTSTILTCCDKFYEMDRNPIDELNNYSDGLFKLINHHMNAKKLNIK